MTAGESQCYSMERPYGIALIVNVKNFLRKEGVNLCEREGSDKDAKELEELWARLGFTVKCACEKVKAYNIYDVLRETAKEIDKQQNSNCFVCCIMSHGTMGSIYGSDAELLGIKDIIDLFKEINCKALAGKPKLFFIQACRGGVKLDRTTDAEVPETGEDCVTMPATPSDADATLEAVDSQEMDGNDSSIVHGDIDCDSDDSEFRRCADPNEPHFLLGYSTARGKVKAVFRVFHTYVHARKTLKRFPYYI